MRTWPTLTFLVVAILGSNHFVAAQEDKKDDDKKPATDSATADAPAPGSFEELFAAWQELNDNIDDNYNRLITATDDKEKKELKNLYELNVTQANKMLPLLRDAGMKAYTEKPNEDKSLLRVLIGIAANDARQDRYEEAYELTQLLIENECDIDYVYCIAGACAWSLHDFENVKTYLGKVADEKGDVPHGVGGHVSQKLTGYLKDADDYQKLWVAEQAIRAKEKEAGDLPQVLLTTNRGDILIELFENEAPGAVGNFISLVEKKYYDGLTFHRVLPGFMAQGGCPDGTGGGGPGYTVYCECDEEKYPKHRKHFRGSLSMAHAGQDTGGSQFFLTFNPTSHLNGRHTVFGRVATVEGLKVLADLKRRNPSELSTPDKIETAVVVEGTKRDHKYEPKIVPGSEETSESDDKKDDDKKSDDKKDKKDDKKSDKDKSTKE